jgi:hypothetical protein
MNDRLKWALLRRRQLAGAIEGFSASLFSHATADCRFEGHNRLSGSAALQASALGRGSYVNAARLNSVRVARFCSIGFEASVGLGERPVDRFATNRAFYAPRNPVGPNWSAAPFAPEVGTALPVFRWRDLPLKERRTRVPQIERTMGHALLGELKGRLGAARDAAPW